MQVKEIKITDIENIKIGHYSDIENGTGVSVIICENGMGAGSDIRGGGPASRENTLTATFTNTQILHALVLGGGSAYGLDAAGGVMKYLEEHQIGYPVGPGYVPLVAQADIFDLTCGSFDVRPDFKMGYNACINAYKEAYTDGCVGAGTGATVGKFLGMDYCTKTGCGSYAIQIGDIKIGAFVVVNALGNVYDSKGNIIAGLLNQEKNGFLDCEDLLIQNYMKAHDNKFVSNTTIGAIITNASFDKAKLCKIASMAHNGYARSINPIHTSADGDTIYALSTGNVNADCDLVGTFAAKVMSKAIENAVWSSSSNYGIPCAKDIKNGSK